LYEGHTAQLLKKMRKMRKLRKMKKMKKMEMRKMRKMKKMRKKRKMRKKMRKKKKDNSIRIVSDNSNSVFNQPNGPSSLLFTSSASGLVRSNLQFATVSTIDPNACTEPFTFVWR
jgi:hypothetical protein